MLMWIIQITIISIVLIFLVHYLINFFKETLTVPKIKDLVNNPTEKYENIYSIINKNNNLRINNEGVTNEYNLVDLIPNKNESSETMKSELKNFLKKQLHNTDNSNTYLEPNFSGNFENNSYLTY